MLRWLRRFFKPRIEVTIIWCPNRLARKIVVSSITINNYKTKGVITMATLKSTEKVAYKLKWLDEDGSETQDAVTEITVSAGDGSIVTVTPTADHEGWINTVDGAKGSVDIVWSAKNSVGEPIQGILNIIVDDGVPPPITKVAKSIGIELGEPVTK